MSSFSISTYSLTNEELEGIINKAKHQLLASMVKENKISIKDANDIGTNWAIILKKPNFFCNIWDKITKKDARHLIVVKQINLTTPEEDTNDTKPSQVC